MSGSSGSINVHCPSKYTQREILSLYTKNAKALEISTSAPDCGSLSVKAPLLALGDGDGDACDALSEIPVAGWPSINEAPQVFLREVDVVLARRVGA